MFNRVFGCMAPQNKRSGDSEETERPKLKVARTTDKDIGKQDKQEKNRENQRTYDQIIYPQDEDFNLKQYSENIH